ncbi:MAG: hypothetical protein ACUVX1_06730 [Chloroflexota bacterium]
MKKASVALVVLLLIGLAAIAFWYADFHASTSESRTESQVSTYRSSKSGVKAEELLAEREVALYVAGADELADALRVEMLGFLQASESFGKVTCLDLAPEQTDQPVLVIKVQSEQGLWTPFFAQSGLAVRVAFASDGDVSWWHQSGPVILSGDESIVRVEGNLQVVDDTRGVTSRLAYQKHLGRQIAKEVSKALQNVLSSPT